MLCSTFFIHWLNDNTIYLIIIIYLVIITQSEKTCYFGGHDIIIITDIVSTAFWLLSPPSSFRQLLGFFNAPNTMQARLNAKTIRSDTPVAWETSLTFLCRRWTFFSAATPWHFHIFYGLLFLKATTQLGILTVNVNPEKHQFQSCTTLQFGSQVFFGPLGFVTRFCCLC